MFKFSVTVIVDGNEVGTAIVEARDSWQARTRAMLVLNPSVSGNFVEYVVEEVA